MNINKKQLGMQLHEEYQRLCNRIDEDYKNKIKPKITKVDFGSNSSKEKILEEVKKLLFNYENEWRVLENPHKANELSNDDFNISKARQGFVSSTHKFTDLSNRLSKELGKWVEEFEEPKKKLELISDKTQKETYTCSECFREKEGKYFYNQSSKTIRKFCSKECYINYYGENCSKCTIKSLMVYPVRGSSSVFYCSDCYKKERTEQEKDLITHCKYCSTTLPEYSIFNVCDKEECLAKMNKEIEDKKNKNSNNEDNDDKSNQIKSNQIKSNQIKSNQIKSNIQYFSSNSISSVEITSEGDLDIKYDKGGQQTIENGDLSTELQKIKTMMEKNGTKKLTKEDLEKGLQKLEEQRRKLEKGEEQNPKNKPWGLIVGGSVIGIVSLVVILVRRKKK